ncbi:hypothetical protein [Halonatronum saccharophilum]|uniref:hypothetical protein n=1 Tax=Halonatronum saccharophilum TaxID=150060 RepID=UPI0004870615|nr:hypothetical protein [Halonatronum saccharophilum]
MGSEDIINKNLKFNLKDLPQWKRYLALVLAILATFLWANLLVGNDDLDIAKVDNLKVEEITTEAEIEGLSDNKNFNPLSKEHLNDPSRESPFLSEDKGRSGEFTYQSSKEEEEAKKSLDIELTLQGILSMEGRGVALVKKDGKSYLLEEGEIFKSFEVRIEGEDKITLISKEGYGYEVGIKDGDEK